MAMKNHPEHQKNLFEYLSRFITENKRSRFIEVIENRTRHLSVVLEDIYQPHNASAVLRTCDCLGIQDIHIIENRNTYTLNKSVSLGSSKWVTMKRYNERENNTSECLTSLKCKGYKIAVTSPHKNDVSIEDLAVDQKLAVVFGTELEGISDMAMGLADTYVRIPMHGFTESYNISVSAAITLYHLIRKIRQSGISWKLSEEEQSELLLEWARKVVKRPELHEKNFLKKFS